MPRSYAVSAAKSLRFGEHRGNGATISPRVSWGRGCEGEGTGGEKGKKAEREEILAQNWLKVRITKVEMMPFLPIPC